MTKETWGVGYKEPQLYPQIIPFSSLPLIHNKHNITQLDPFPFYGSSFPIQGSQQQRIYSIIKTKNLHTYFKDSRLFPYA